MANAHRVDRIEVEAVNARKRRSLYKARESIHPMRVAGHFRRLKWWLMGILLGIYYITPWIRWDRGPGMPDQAVLIDLEHRRFFFFFIEIWPQEFYFVAGLLIMAGIGLFLVTSVLGRAWCGYACPQTVWVDLYIHVERWIDGDRNARFRMEKAPWTFTKTRKRLAKWLIWLLIAVATGGAWVFYFADAPTLFVDLFTGEAAPVAYATVAVLTATTFVFGGFMREQVCTYMCPWPRIQGAMLDENSLSVTYNAWRGEPRGRHRKGPEAHKLGDCIDCNQCVAVCPMGIDIRDGGQLECINCALCIDACNNVMEKTGGTPNLISYNNLRTYDAQEAGREAPPLKRTVLRPRTFIYAGIWALVGLAMLFALAVRDRLELNVLHDRNPQYVILSDGAVRNGYTIKILNMQLEERRVLLRVADLPGGLMTVVGQDLWPSRTREFILEPDKVRELKVFVTVPGPEIELGATPFRFSVTDLGGIEEAHYGATFYAPGD
ncbi:MAG: cytochrome c oxidase accessory protein CcoG [Rhizobiales bacterium NRL2]|jgi:cytochrome c oxidase accessory protein FixG|nr:MAG: cytochrome c oxidase accessory protein CcoG [Rhizobiales bacterium NRL2]